MPEKEEILLEYREKIAEDEAILKEVHSDRALLEEIRYRILRKKLHNQLTGLITEAVESGKATVESIEDFATLVELDLLLLK